MRKLLTKKNICLLLFISVALMPILLGHAHAQAIDEVAEQATDRANKAFGYILNSFCFIVGGSLLAAGILSLYQKHRNNNAGTSMAYIASAFLCGGFLIGFPFVVRTASFSFWNTTTTVTGEQRMMQFDK
ncbi:hypothetical protein GOB86_10450 [Acetobacter lambici]|uniref:DUF4134 domain-containing protein n=1 Tax=Acetobacter lambici TaxID=1332824 RepID=A0ABT1F180_9PROT|nr:hypothetical protein [Acetobacter lambici]MCP1242780.1 hypothetical protein [Acetobacter lambici]MCP1258950.1 hypothetical protein [Acetobacter lambici]NHO57469.1 hypothetical protein [Acetobacter lambici]